MVIWYNGHNKTDNLHFSLKIFNYLIVSAKQGNTDEPKAASKTLINESH